MEVTIYALILLIQRLISVLLIGDVLRKQLILARRPIEPRARATRSILIATAICILLMSIYPVYLDLITILGGSSRPDIIKIDSVAYNFNNATFSLFLSFFIWFLYRRALED